MNDAERTQVEALIALARDEDLGSGDLSAAVLPEREKIATFDLVAEEKSVLAGIEVAPAILAAYDDEISIEFAPGMVDGAALVEPPSVVATITGPLGIVLSAERVLLNFLQRLCGVATLTRQFVDAVAGTAAGIYDTRKTLPGWRTLDKYAVRCGGGKNHRRGLYDAVMIKDNHLGDVPPERTAAAVFEMLNTLSTAPRQPDFVTVEADNFVQVEQLLKVVGVDVILLDNFSPAELREAVAMREAAAMTGRVAYEASGGITLDTVRAVAETGVERISIGAVTHSAVASSLKLERRPC